MADTKISALTAANYAAGSESIPIVQSGATKKLTVSEVNAGAMIYLDADYTLTSTTDPQQLFDTTANGRLTISETGLYEFDAMVWLTSMSSTSGNAKFNLIGAGTATLDNQIMTAIGVDASTPTVANNHTGAWAIGSSILGGAAGSVFGGTSTQMPAIFRGVFKVTAAGTLIPSVELITAAAAVVEAGSYFRLRKLAAAGVNSVGNWD